MRSAAAVIVMAALMGGCGLRRHKYDNPITKQDIAFNRYGT